VGACLLGDLFVGSLVRTDETGGCASLPMDLTAAGLADVLDFDPA
jgi:hypothetical protein